MSMLTLSSEGTARLYRRDVRMDGTYGPAHGGWADLPELDSDVGIGTTRDAGSGTGTVAPRPGHRSDAHGQRGPLVWSAGLPGRRWPAVALVGSYELLMMVIRGSQAVPDRLPSKAEARDSLQEQARLGKAEVLIQVT